MPPGSVSVLSAPNSSMLIPARYKLLIYSAGSDGSCQIWRFNCYLTYLILIICSSFHGFHFPRFLTFLNTHPDLSGSCVLFRTSSVFQNHDFSSPDFRWYKNHNFPVTFPTGNVYITLSLTLHQNPATYRAADVSLRSLVVLMKSKINSMPSMSVPMGS